MKRTDSELQSMVTDELNWDTLVKSSEVNVRVDNSVVTLTGSVGSFGEWQAAERAAHRVVGVQDVANDIEINAPGVPRRTDTELAQSVRRALEWDVFVPEQCIKTTVSEGWVTLEGTVENWNQRAAAERAICNLHGLTGMVNKIEVNPSSVASDIRQAIESALERRADRQVAQLKVEVEDGRVTLTGKVATLADKKAALGAAHGTFGVRNVVDHLQIV